LNQPSSFSQPSTIKLETIHPRLRETIIEALAKGASDIHLKVGLPPTLRTAGQLEPANGPAWQLEQLKTALFSLLTPLQRETFEARMELDAGISISEHVRIRLNLYSELDTIGGAIRLIPSEAPSLAQLGAPAVLQELAGLKSGLVIVSGATGTGKTTLLAGMINHINGNEAKHIYTIEDPVEYVFKPKRSIVTQREVGYSTLDFATAVRSSLRADPDVLMVGEMRDRQTVLAVLEAAETGLLVLTTLHTSSSIKAVQRILSMFQPSEKEFLQLQLSGCLRAVVCQQLLPSVDGDRRPVHEILVATAAVREALMKGEFEQLEEYIANGSYDGMQSMDATIYEAVAAGLIDPAVAVAHAINPDEMNRILRGAS